jgi:hypothetical protein
VSGVVRVRCRYGVVLLAAVSGMAITPAAAEMAGFRAPSGNIHCMYFFDSEGALLRCDILETANPPPEAPADCELDWGNAFVMAPDSQDAERICHGDTVADSSLPILDYGSDWQHGGFTCASEKTGISCRNERDAGWDLARARQKLY